MYLNFDVISRSFQYCKANNMRVYILQLLTSLLRFAMVFSTKCTPQYEQIYNVVLRNNILLSSMVQNQQDCTKKCTSYIGCYSVNYYHKQKMCELNKATHRVSPVDLDYDEEGTYIKLKEQDVCSDTYCSAGQICLPKKDFL